MKVYLAEVYNNESEMTLGIYSTLEAAKKRCGEYKSSIFTGKVITEMEIDKDSLPLAAQYPFWQLSEDGKWVKFGKNGS